MIFPITIGSITSSKFIWEQLNLLDGSMTFSGAQNSYVSIANDTSIQLSTYFTVEWWMKLDSTGTGNSPRVFSYGTWGVPTDIDFAVEIANKTTLGVWWQDTFRTFGNITQNEWGHYVVVGTGSSIKVYKNGVQLGTTWSTRITTATNKDLSIGNETIPSTAGAFKGQISNFHIVKGAQIYDGVVVPIAPIYPDANSTVLMLASDSNSVGTNSVGTVTPTLNNVSWSSVVPQIENPMKTLSLSSAVEITGYTYVSNLGLFVFGTGDFTVEWFQYLNAEGGAVFNYTGTGPHIQYDSQASEEWLIYRDPDMIVGNFRNQIGKWVHIAIERWNGNLYYYQNGNLVLAESMTNNLSSVTDFSIGSGSAGASGFVDGYLSNFHIVKGTTVYTEPYFNANGVVGDFTPPTTDLSPNANTLGLYFKSGNTTSDTSGQGSNLNSFGISSVAFNAKTMP